MRRRISGLIFELGRGRSGMSATVSIEDVERVAELANLDLEADEKPRMQRDLNAILEYVAQLGELDTSGIEPMAQVSDLVNAVADTGHGIALRVDVLRPSLPRERVMEEAPETDGAFFKTPKVIER
jgi:aspartyl-tRNA(Asn)/glutamyl-tRNA(Gln) amidotransferase subunit C